MHWAMIKSGKDVEGPYLDGCYHGRVMVSKGAPKTNSKGHVSVGVEVGNLVPWKITRLLV